MKSNFVRLQKNGRKEQNCKDNLEIVIKLLLSKKFKN